LQYLASWYEDFYSHIKSEFLHRFNRDIIGAFRQLQDEGHIEIITCAATHGYLPLLSTDSAIRAQIKTGIASFYIHAEKNKVVVVENDRTESVGHDESISIGHDRTESVDNNETITIGKDRSESVGNNEVISVGSNRTLTIGKNHEVSIGENETLTIGKNQATAIGSNYTIDVGKNYTLTAGDQIDLICGSSRITMKKNGDIKISGKNIQLIGSGKIDIKADSTVTVKGSKILQN
jgi:type VI secretion system secreted protein VgrG